MHELEQCNQNKASKDRQEERSPAESVLATVCFAGELHCYQFTPSNKNESACKTQHEASAMTEAQVHATPQMACNAGVRKLWPSAVTCTA